MASFFNMKGTTVNSFKIGLNGPELINDNNDLRITVNKIILDNNDHYISTERYTGTSANSEMLGGELPSYYTDYADSAIATKLGDIGNNSVKTLLDEKVDISTYNTKISSIETNIGENNSGKSICELISDNANDISDINSKIPSTADNDGNKLADRNFVNSSIENLAAFYVYYTQDNNSKIPFPNKFTLLNTLSLPYIDGEQRIPGHNDYCIVLADESKQDSNAATAPTTRYSYTGYSTDSTYDPYKWAFQYIINNTGLTSDQLAAIDSGITANTVQEFTGHISNSNNPHNVSKSQIGLGNVDNTSDMDKPVSTAQLAAINGKANISNPSFTGNVEITPNSNIEKTDSGNTRVVTPNGLIINDAVNNSKIVIDSNDIQALNNNTPQNLYINGFGGNTYISYDPSNNFNTRNKVLVYDLDVNGTLNASNLQGDTKITLDNTMSSSSPHGLMVTDNRTDGNGYTYMVAIDSDDIQSFRYKNSSYQIASLYLNDIGGSTYVSRYGDTYVRDLIITGNSNDNIVPSLSSPANTTLHINDGKDTWVSSGGKTFTSNLQVYGMLLGKDTDNTVHIGSESYSQDLFAHGNVTVGSGVLGDSGNRNLTVFGTVSTFTVSANSEYINTSLLVGGSITTGYITANNSITTPLLSSPANTTLHINDNAQTWISQGSKAFMTNLQVYDTIFGDNNNTVKIGNSNLAQDLLVTGQGKFNVGDNRLDKTNIRGLSVSGTDTSNAGRINTIAIDANDIQGYKTINGETSVSALYINGYGGDTFIGYDTSESTNPKAKLRIYDLEINGTASGNGVSVNKSNNTLVKRSATGAINVNDIDTDSLTTGNANFTGVITGRSTDNSVYIGDLNLSQNLLVFGNIGSYTMNTSALTATAIVTTNMNINNAVGIGNSLLTVDIGNTNNATYTTTGKLLINTDTSDVESGNTFATGSDSVQIRYDQQDIQAYSNGSTGNLFLNDYGSDVVIAKKGVTYVNSLNVTGTSGRNTNSNYVNINKTTIQAYNGNSKAQLNINTGGGNVNIGTSGRTTVNNLTVNGSSSVAGGLTVSGQNYDDGESVVTVDYLNNIIPLPQVQDPTPITVKVKGGYDVNTQYGPRLVQIGNGSNCPSNSQYGVVLNFPYRNADVGTKPDFMGQIFIPNGDDGNVRNGNNAMYYRTSLAENWNPWQQVVAMDKSTGEINLYARSQNNSSSTVSKTGYVNSKTITVNTNGSSTEVPRSAFLKSNNNGEVYWGSGISSRFERTSEGTTEIDSIYTPDFIGKNFSKVIVFGESEDMRYSAVFDIQEITKDTSSSCPTLSIRNCDANTNRRAAVRYYYSGGKPYFQVVKNERWSRICMMFAN